MSLPVYNSDQMRQWDAFTIEHEPIASADLMERAATLAAKSILGRNAFESVAIFCGPGNNGGDGLVIARLLADVKKVVSVYYLKFAAESEDFKINFKRLPKSVQLFELTENQHYFDTKADLIIDAIFGSGLNRPVKGWIASVILGMNNLKTVKIAIDIPSGLYATDNHKNESFPAVFRADETLSFMAPKMPFFFPGYADFVGKFRIIDINLHKDYSSDPLAHFITSADIRIKKRSAFSHKGNYGALTIAGGLENMTGAIVITAHAAARAGAGYVHVMSGKNGRLPLNFVIPEVIWQDAENFHLPEKTTAIAIGPGLGTSEKALRLMEHLAQFQLPMVLDADALNLISENDHLISTLPPESVLTPHIGELNRLVGNFRSDEELLEAQQNYSQRHQVYIIQKGPFSKLTTPEGKVYINSTGNPGMASAGMGDALCGIIGSLLAQGYPAQKAALFGMYLHGYAADLQTRDQGQIGLLASDVISRLQEAVNHFVKNEE